MCEDKAEGNLQHRILNSQYVVFRSSRSYDRAYPLRQIIGQKQSKRIYCKWYCYKKNNAYRMKVVRRRPFYFPSESNNKTLPNCNHLISVKLTQTTLIVLTKDISVLAPPCTIIFDQEEIILQFDHIEFEKAKETVIKRSRRQKHLAYKPILKNWVCDDQYLLQALLYESLGDISNRLISYLPMAINNVVASFSIGNSMNFEIISNKISNVQSYERYQLNIIRLRKPPCSACIRSSGQVICGGSNRFVDGLYSQYYI
ncbi:hypothetical protein GJ496_010699 [Pomphorhynchus laevis]|nr:hypothetical protein GJ496_010699 [Pomphorhynchus laevis]